MQKKSLQTTTFKTGNIIVKWEKPTTSSVSHLLLPLFFLNSPTHMVVFLGWCCFGPLCCIHPSPTLSWAQMLGGMFHYQVQLEAMLLLDSRWKNKFVYC